MQNIKTSVKGKILIIEIDMTKRFGRSSSGKTIIVASSQGNQAVEGGDGLIIGLNAYVKPGAGE